MGQVMELGYHSEELGSRGRLSMGRSVFLKKCAEWCGERKRGPGGTERSEEVFPSIQVVNIEQGPTNYVYHSRHWRFGHG